MPALSNSVKKLANSLIRYGVVDAKAVDIAKKTVKAFPQIGKVGRNSDFISVVKAVEDNAPYSNLREARGNQSKNSVGLKKATEKEIRIGAPTNYYIAYTTLPPRFVNDIILGIMDDWVDFATGRSTLGGKRLKHPTGAYASSISATQSNRFFTVYSDSPYADVIETGLRKKSLKSYIGNFRNNHGGKYVNIKMGESSLVPSDRYPMAKVTIDDSSRRMKATTKVSPVTIHRREAAKFSGGSSPFRTLSKNSSSAWTMPVYHPAWQLWRKLSTELRFVDRLLK